LLINPTVVEDLQRHQPITGLHQQNGPTISVSYQHKLPVFEVTQKAPIHHFRNYQQLSTAL